MAPVVFICGGMDSEPRDTLRTYLSREHPTVNVFYAERVWDIISSNPGLGALKMESDLAALSDLVVIIVESPGTFAELGAFSHVDDLRKKLLPIVDIKYRAANSFINTGPIRWIDQESEFKPSIWVPLDQILLSSRDIDRRIQSIPRPMPSKISNLAANRKHLLFFVCDLVAVIAPASISMIEYFLERIIPSAPLQELEVPLLVGLAEAMGLLRKDVVGTDLLGERTFFSPADPDSLASPFHRVKWVDLASLRSEYVSKLQVIPEAIKTMREVTSGL